RRSRRCSRTSRVGSAAFLISSDLSARLTEVDAPGRDQAFLFRDSRSESARGMAVLFWGMSDKSTVRGPYLWARMALPSLNTRTAFECRGTDKLKSGGPHASQ